MSRRTVRRYAVTYELNGRPIEGWDETLELGVNDWSVEEAAGLAARGAAANLSVVAATDKLCAVLYELDPESGRGGDPAIACARPGTL